MKKAVFHWSGGKDSALALLKVLDGKEWEVVALLTIIDISTRRSSMHGIPVELLRAQAESIGLPLELIDLPVCEGQSDYHAAMEQAVGRFKPHGVTGFIFGDIALHDVKSYREQQLAPHGIRVIEPLWEMTTEQVIEEFLTSGLETVIVTTNADVLDARFIGRRLDRNFINELPPQADVCGENGEYHTFCYAGAPFRYPVGFRLGDPWKEIRPIRLSDGSLREFSYWHACLTP